VLYENANLRGAAAMHDLNENEAAAFRAYGLKNPVAVIPNGVHLPDLSVSLLRPSFMGQDHRKVMLFLARIHPKKGLLELVEAWQRAASNSPQLRERWRLVIAGWDDGGHLEVLRRAITERGLERDVFLAGPLLGNAKDAALQHASAFVLPSYSEGLPMSVLEAWSWGLPVFMTAACNLSGSFDRGAAIEITTNPLDMAKTLAAALLDENHLRYIAKAGQSLVKERYTWDRVVENMAQLYGWLLGGGTKPEFVFMAQR
jgi:glycosyltransferase involved in cell wall biosynthesis